MSRDEMKLILAIVKRAQELGITIGKQITQVLDIENAHVQFNLRLQDFLNADDFNFAHDFVGIQHSINRQTSRIETLFVPRYAAAQ